MRVNYLKNTHHTRFLAKAFLGLMLVYLSFHLFLSERSIPAYFQTNADYKNLSMEVAMLTEQRDKLHDRVTRLRPSTLDMDLIEEYSIRMLGYGAPNSIIITE